MTQRTFGWRPTGPAIGFQGVPLVVGGILLLLVWFGTRHTGSAGLGFRLDDSWIHMVYGRELAETGRLAYNRGVPATGATAPLWAGLLAVIHLLLGRISLEAVILGVYGLGAAAYLACIGLANALTAELTGERRFGALAALMLALSPPMAAAAFSGMEVGLCAALLLAGLLALARKRHGLAGLWLALASLTRPEALAVLGPVLLVVCVTPGRTIARILRIAAPAVVSSGLWIAYDIWATGHLLPATFYGKGHLALGALPDRLAVGVTGILAQIPPFWGYGAWIALLGCAWASCRRHTLLATWLPLLAGLGFSAANLALIAPADPRAFYHLRYLLPAVPLLIVALGVGAAGLTRVLRPPMRALAPILLLIWAAVGAGITVSPTSTHLHNDTRNINEVQRALGEWIAENTAPDDWIAATDAGAVRYFSRRATIDLMGLNTPEIRWVGPSWLRAHPVSAVAFMPSWLRPVRPDLQIARTFRTEGYTVTSNPKMAVQVVAVWPGDAGDAPVPVEFVGLWRTAVYCRPWRSPGAH